MIERQQNIKKGDGILRDIEIAKKILKDENQKIVVVKNGEVVFKSTDRGIKPMYNIAKNLKDEVKGAALADRVIGKGAAILCIYIGINEIYTDLISENAKNLLDKNTIKYEFYSKCAYIKNRDKTDYCPIEKRSFDIEDPKVLLDRIEIFLNDLK